jgi:Arc/MetJ-type ribon-helix-helix transcriptional regulator
LTNPGGGSIIRSMTITIPDELDEFVRAKLQTGGFESPAAVVTAALTAWQGQEVYRAMDRDEVEQLLLEAIDSPRIPWDEANFDRMIESLRKKHGAS